MIITVYELMVLLHCFFIIIDHQYPLWIIPLIIIATAVTTFALIAIVFIVYMKVKCYRKESGPWGRLF